MKDTIAELLQNPILTTTTVSVSIASFFANLLMWFDQNLVKLSAAASFVLLVLMVINLYCDIVRKNRASKIDQIEQELRIEKLRQETNHEVH